MTLQIDSPTRSEVESEGEKPKTFAIYSCDVTFSPNFLNKIRLLPVIIRWQEKVAEVAKARALASKHYLTLPLNAEQALRLQLELIDPDAAKPPQLNVILSIGLNDHFQVRVTDEDPRANQVQLEERNIIRLVQDRLRSFQQALENGNCQVDLEKLTKKE